MTALPAAVTVSSNPALGVTNVTPGPVAVGSGPIGPVGPAGPSGILATLRGAYNPITTYTAGPPPDAVIGSNGHWYVSLTNGNVGHDPTTDGGVHWADQLPSSVVSGSPSLGRVGASIFNSMDPAYGAVGDGVTDDTAAILLAQADMRLYGGVLRFTAAHKMTQPLYYISGDRYEGISYLTTGLVFEGVPIGLRPRDPTDFTDFVRMENFFIQGDSTGAIAVLLASCRQWTVKDVEVTGGGEWTQHSLCLFGQRWADGTSTSGGASAGVPPKTTLSSGITAAATSIPVADTSQYQLGSARLTANPQSGVGFVPAAYGDALANGSQPRLAKICTQPGGTPITLAVTMKTWDTSFQITPALPVGTGTNQIPASGAMLVDTEVIWYSAYNASTGVFSGITRQQRASHASGKNVFVAEIFSYTSVDATHFLGCVRGLNGTTAYAHSSGAGVYQNPGDSTFNRFLGSCRFLSGGASYVRLGGTFGSTWLNNGTSNQNYFSGARAGGTGSATLAAWHIEAGSVNLLEAIQHGNSAGDGIFIQWYSNTIVSYTAGPLGVSSAAVHFSPDSTSHDCEVYFLHYDSTGNGQSVKDDSGNNWSLPAYGGGLKLARPSQGTTYLLNESVWNHTGQLTWHDASGNDVALTGGLAEGSAASYTLAIYDRVVIVNGASASYTRTLPDATTCASRRYIVKNAAATNSIVTVNTTSAQTIDGQTTYTLAQYDSVEVVSDGTNWSVV